MKLMSRFEFYTGRSGGSALDVVLISFEKSLLMDVSNLMQGNTAINHFSAFDNLKKAEDYLRHHAIDLILFDADDNEIGWIIPYKRMKAFHPNVKVALMSSSRDAAVKAYETGVWDYLLKPVKESQLKRIIAKCR